MNNHAAIQSVGSKIVSASKLDFSYIIIHYWRWVITKDEGIDGVTVVDEWIPKGRASVEEQYRPSLYEQNAIIQEVGVRLVEDKQNDKNHKIQPNWYYTSMPPLNTIHFESMVPYQVYATYGNMTVITGFIILPEVEN